MKKWLIIGALGLLGAGIAVNHMDQIPTNATSTAIVKDKMGNARGTAYEHVPFSQSYTSELISAPQYPSMPLPVVGVYCANLPIFERIEKAAAYRTRWHIADGSVYDNPLLMTTEAYRSWVAAGSSKINRPPQLAQPKIWLSLSGFNQETKGFFYQTDIACNKPPKNSPYGNRVVVLNNMDKEAIQREAYEVPGTLTGMRPTPKMLNDLKTAYTKYTASSVEVPISNKKSEASDTYIDVSKEISSQ